MKLAEWGVLRMLTATGLVLVAAFVLAAYAGLGAWSQQEPIGASSPEVLPTAVESAPASVVDATVIYQHSLFSLNRGIDTDSFQNIDASASAQSNNLNAQNLNLLSVMITPSVTVAVFSRTGEKPFRVKLGETLPNSALVFSQAQPRSVLLSGAGSNVTLELRVFDGQGGSSPSATPVLNGVVNNPLQSAAGSTTTNDATAEADLRQRIAEKRGQQQQQNSQDQIP